MTIYHKHHIVPRHAGGTDEPSNLILLTVEEHAEAHRLLYEEHGRREDRTAWLSLSGMISSQELIAEISKAAGRKGGLISGPLTKGRKASQATKEKMSEAQKKHNAEHGHNGHLLVASVQSRIDSGTHPSKVKWTCEHCSKQGTGLSNYSRWHGDSCKLKLQQ